MKGGFRAIRLDLRAFHAAYNMASPEMKMQGLIAMQRKQYRSGASPAIAERREQFEVNWKNRRYFHRSCWVCWAHCEVRHHVISLKQGGTNTTRNIVPLCRPCHAKVHPWLMKGLLDERT